MSAEMGFFISISVLISTGGAVLLLAKLPYKRGQLLTAKRCILIGVFGSAAILFVPIYNIYFYGEQFQVFRSIVLAVYSAMQLFFLNGDFELVTAFTSNLTSYIKVSYSVLASAIYILCPLLTFGFVISLVNGVSAYNNLFFHYFADAYIFSELNVESVTLATSIKSKHRNALIAFTNTSEKDTSSELYEQVKELRAACFKGDFANINFKLHSKAKKVYLFAIGKDETKNLEQSLKISKRFAKENNFSLYVFTSNKESEILFCKTPYHGIKIRRINTVRSYVNNFLYRDGYSVFEGAHQTSSGDRVISAAIVGLGQFGTELLKTLSWFGQMDGYQIKIDAFDQNQYAESNFIALCPELMARNGIYEDGEAQYDIKIHSGVDVNSSDFIELFNVKSPFTYVFVSLGCDSANISAAVNIRMLSERNGSHPRIQTIIYDGNKTDVLNNATDFRGNEYEIEYIDGLRSLYSEDSILNSELDKKALERHLKYGDEKSFWAYEYNYRSSIATAIHMKMRILCGIIGADKSEGELTDSEDKAIAMLEHKRWNAYMRSEGYVFSGSTDKNSRNDLGKMHYDLVPFDKLSREEQHKDSRVGTK